MPVSEGLHLNSGGFLSQREDGVAIEVTVRPRAGRCKVAGVHGDRLRVEVTAPPEDGRATEQALATLARAVGVRASQAVLLRGAHERHKTVLLRGTTVAACQAALADE